MKGWHFWKFVVRSPFLSCHPSTRIGTMSILQICKCHSSCLVVDWPENTQENTWDIHAHIWVHTTHAPRPACLHLTFWHWLCNSASSLMHLNSQDIKLLPVNRPCTSTVLIIQPWESNYWFLVSTPGPWKKREPLCFSHPCFRCSKTVAMKQIFYWQKKLAIKQAQHRSEGWAQSGRRALCGEKI